MMDDLISRKEALKVCEKYNGRGFIWSCIRGDIEQLSSAESAELKAIKKQALSCSTELLKLVAMISKEEKNEGSDR